MLGQPYLGFPLRGNIFLREDILANYSLGVYLGMISGEFAHA